MSWQLLRKIINYFAFSFLLVFVFGKSANCREVDYGLYIKGYPEIDSKKTSLVLNNNTPVNLGRELKLAFDMFVRKGNVFGLVFRLITDNNNNIDLMFTAGNDDERYPILVINDEAHTISKEIVFEQWIHVVLKVSKTENRISLVFGDKELSIPFELSRSTDAKIVFGRCTIEPFQMADIASVNIKDIQLFRNDILTHYWRLREHNNNSALDSLNGIPALATNPVWMLDMYATWQKVYSKKVQNNSLFAFDGRNKFYVVQPDTNKILAFDLTQNTEAEIAVLHGCMASNAPNQLYYDARRNELVSYNMDENRYSRFSFQTQSWSDDRESTTDPGYLNNSSLFSGPDSAVFSFGGYGYYSYNNTLIRMSPNDSRLETVTLTGIPPRYSAATAIVGDILYVFGGRGNPSGRQELSPRNYYDLYAVSIPGYKVTKMWEVADVNPDFLPSENMIVDAEKNAFYVFTTYLKGGELIRITPDEMGFDTVSFPIEENLEGLYLYTNLYHSPDRDELYVLICKKKNQSETDVSIYSMNFPPISLSSIRQTAIVGPKDRNISNSYLVFIAIIGGSFLLYFFYRYRHKKMAVASLVAEMPDGEHTAMPVMLNDLTDSQIENSLASINEEFSKSSICFLGGFSVKDREGNNISGQFTPTLKYLLILLVLHARQDSRGLTSRKMINLLWPDKHEESAKNNRNVYLSKLRTFADQLGNINVYAKNETWSLQLNDVQCDYLEILMLFDRLKTGDLSDRPAIERLLALLQRGELLPAVETDWIDAFKSEFSGMTVELLIKLLNGSPYIDNDEIKLMIADILFIHDPVNEEALHLKCSILFNSGRKGIAKHVYDNFCRDYYQLLGIEFNHSLTEIVT